MSLPGLSSNKLRQKFLDFFKERGHKILPSSSLVPENDPTVLFTTAGMHPLVPYIIGEVHPEGKRLCSVQPCVRTDDIDKVGDESHLTFFEMLGNWSLGDYWKEDAIKWSYEFLTEELGLEHKKLAITCFAGDKDAPKDTGSAEIWKGLKIPEERVVYLGKKDNWWGPAGQTGPCGPDTEMFYWGAKEPVPEEFDPEDERWIEIWNDVFMEYDKQADGSFKPLKQKNVDTGLGFERMLAILQGKEDMFATELFWPIIQKIEEISGKKYQENKKAFRIIADHIRASIALISDGVLPSNKDQGYILRRLIRRAIVNAKQIGIEENFCGEFSDSDKIKGELEKEESKFRKTLDEGIKTLKRIYGRAIGGIDPDNLPKGIVIKDNKMRINGEELFNIYQTYGLPIEISQEIMTNWGIAFDQETIEAAFEKHRELSRTASAGMFKGGLADNKIETTRLHTAAHLLLAALRQVLGEQVEQKGSNITEERLRFDFNNPEKLTPEQIQKIEGIVNEEINEDLPVAMQKLSLEEAKKSGATGSFHDRYGDVVKIFTIGPSPSAQDKPPFSREICGGPHVKNTSELGHFKIIKEESSSAGIRRIKAILK